MFRPRGPPILRLPPRGGPPCPAAPPTPRRRDGSHATADGAEGVARVVEILPEELEMAMALRGRPSLAALDHTVLWDAP
ncbi:MAG TPA: alpha-hydroxy-acid oxidizing protein [Longimicrobium sp.]|nr:alpha-hydroxy-acid oxidizing protein [Longimicrobium sp.]